MTAKSVALFIAHSVSVLVCIVATVSLGYYFPWYLVTAVLLSLLGASGWFLWKFSRIIMILEDDLGQAIQALEDVEGSMEQMIEMKLYFDTPEVQQHVSGVMDSVRMAKFSVNKMVKSLTDRSKQKFVMVIEEEAPGSQEETDQKQQQQQQPIEGTVASVGSRS